MSKSKVGRGHNRSKQRRLTEEQRWLLLMKSEEIDRATFEDDETISRILKLMEGIPLELRLRWAEEWLEEHRRSK
jgi:hypothetical protein